MLISVINRSKKLVDDEVQPVIRAINRQVAEDFEPYWSFGATLRLEGAGSKRISIERASEMRGDAVLYVSDRIDFDGISGFHSNNFKDIPFSVVFTELCDQMGENWTVTLSHEALELVGDPLTNLFVPGPHPNDRRRTVLHLFEMCDAVQAESYRIDGVEVSNFVLPAYFTAGDAEGRRNDYLNTQHDGRGLRSFDINPGGYVNIYDPSKRSGRRWSAVTREADALAEGRLAAKRDANSGRSARRKHACGLV